MKTFSFLATVILVAIIIKSCQTNSPCPETTDKGELFYTQKAFETLPYVGKSRVVYKDQLNQELAFNIVDLGDTVISGRFAGYCETNPGQRIYLEYLKKNRKIRLQNDSINETFFIRIDTELSHDYYDEYDVIKMSIPSVDSAQYQYFKLMVDRRNISDEEAGKMNSLVIYDSEIEILGSNFTDTYHLRNYHQNNSHLIYYNFENGIVSFVDQNGKTWVFERFE